MPSMLEVSEMMHPKKGDVKKKREDRSVILCSFSDNYMMSTVRTPSVMFSRISQQGIPSSPLRQGEASCV